MSRQTAKLSLALAIAFFLTNLTSSQDYRYGTKTPYKPGNLQNVQTPQGCIPAHVNMLVRHGARFPSGGNKESMAILLQKLNKVHSNGFKYKDLSLPWTLPNVYNLAEGSELAPLGEKELYNLGRRFRDRFPTLLTKNYWNRYYEFISTDKQRTARSAAAFSYGLFEGRGTLGNASYQPVPIRYSGPKDNDKLLRFYDTCPRYKHEIEDGAGLKEAKKFAEGPEMKQLIDNMENRLNLKGKLSLTAGDVQELFMLCAFSTLTPENKGWCSLFTSSDFDILSYWTDLENYYSNSYGNEIAYQIGCPLMSDITTTINKFVTNGRPYGKFRFAHSGTVLTLQSLLELYRDPFVLSSTNYKESQNRLFHIYDILPFSANVAFVLYNCSNGYKIQVLVNEKLVVLHCCKNQGQETGTCDLDTFMSCFKEIGSDCNLESMCSLKVSSASLRHVPTFWLIVVVTSIAIHICFGRMTGDVIDNIILMYNFLFINNLHKILTLFGMAIATCVMLIIMLMILISVTVIMMTIMITIITLIVSGIVVSLGVCQQTWPWHESENM